MTKPSSLFRPLAARCGRRDFLRGLLLSGGALGGMSLLPAPVRALVLPETGPYARTELFMGTFVRVQIAGCSQMQASEAAERALALGRRLAALYDRHASGSPVSVLNAQGRLDGAPVELCALLGEAAAIHERLSLFDVSVLPLLQWRQSQGERPDQAAGREVRELVDARAIRLDGDCIQLLRQGMAITLDGIAKGAVADAISAELLRCGCADHLVDAGGDIVARGSAESGRPWMVAVEDPEKRGHYPSVLPLRDQAIATSGNYEQSAGHLCDPRSGAYSRLRSCSVLAARCSLADALATGLSLLPPVSVAAGAAQHGAASLAVDAAGRTAFSSGWPARDA